MRAITGLMRAALRLLFIALALLCVLHNARAVEPEILSLSFDSHFPQTLTASNALPQWVRGIEQVGGRFIDQPACWRVESSAPDGHGRLSFLLDRELIREDLALSILQEENDETDVAVQLFDASNRVVAVDLFANVIAVGKEARTDTFIVPLRKYPAATRIAIRRVHGDVQIYGVVLYPVVTEVEGEEETLQQLAKLLGDPLSPDNPLAMGMKRIAKKKRIPSLEVEGKTPNRGIAAASATVRPLDPSNGNVTPCPPVALSGSGEATLRQILDHHGYCYVDPRTHETGLESIPVEAGRNYSAKVLAKYTAYRSVIGFYLSDSPEDRITLSDDAGMGMDIEFQIPLGAGRICLFDRVLAHGTWYRWQSQPELNLDKQDHTSIFKTRQEGEYLIVWEDMHGLGDRDYNDLVIRVAPR